MADYWRIQISLLTGFYSGEPSRAQSDEIYKRKSRLQFIIWILFNKVGTIYTNFTVCSFILFVPLSVSISFSFNSKFYDSAKYQSKLTELLHYVTKRKWVGQSANSSKSSSDPHNLKEYRITAQQNVNNRKHYNLHSKLWVCLLWFVVRQKLKRG